MKKIVYIVGGLLRPDGMSTILSQKINYLAEHTDYKLYMVLTEKAGSPWYYQISPKVQFVNFNINFDELDTMPVIKKIYYYIQKQKKYRKDLTEYLIDLHADIVVSAMRREINFLNQIPDGSKKVGELHFSKSDYRKFDRSFLPGWMNQRITQWWRRRLVREIKRLDEFVVLSNEDRTAWTELENVRVIYNAIGCFPPKQSFHEYKRVIAAGRYTYQKGFDLLIQAWNLVHQKHPDWRLDIYGEGDASPYRKMVDKYGISSSLICHPATSCLGQEFQKSDFFVLSSRYEGFGLVLAEAMSSGLPCVSFACPCGPKDIISDRKSGLLVDPYDLNQLADKICWLIEHEKERLQMSKMAIESARRFDVNTIMKRWIELFNGLVYQTNCL